MTDQTRLIHNANFRWMNRNRFVSLLVGEYPYRWPEGSHGVMVSTADSDSADRSSILRGTYLIIYFDFFCK